MRLREEVTQAIRTAGAASKSAKITKQILKSLDSPFVFNWYTARMQERWENMFEKTVGCFIKIYYTDLLPE